eukprot:gnl/Dysnectes_brevis/3377_a4248_446.p1 GENE.gnl/Dysnectes_brevis/3377_a4248_446~~gnl/Dysnectes_brevis/3377_a4248_446.p1  ORF type:complete len:821 (-),score=255.47 gnl/Dysnectes_brevis/3377_a4248_446:57-2342(-)
MKTWLDTIPYIVKQLTKGCLNSSCTNPHCKSSGAAFVHKIQGLDMNSVTRLAINIGKKLQFQSLCRQPCKALLVRMAKNGLNDAFHGCNAWNETCKTSTTLDIPWISSTPLPLVFPPELLRYMIHQGITSLKTLAHFFLDSTADMAEAMTLSRVYWYQLTRPATPGYLRQDYLQAVLKAVEKAAGSPSSLDDEDLSALLLLLYQRYNFFNHSDDASKLIGLIASCIGRMTPEMTELAYTLVLSAAQTLGKDAAAQWFGSIIRTLHQPVTLALSEMEIQHSPVMLKHVPPGRLRQFKAVLSTMSIFSNVNREMSVVEPDVFYNDVLNAPKNYNLSTDVDMWLSGRSREFRQVDLTAAGDAADFHFLAFPFLFSPAIKTDILRYECRMAQRREAQVGRGMFGGHIAVSQLILRVRRGNLIQDTVQQLSAISDRQPERLRHPLRVVFHGEPGIDEGGVATEWFQLLTRRLFSPAYGMWRYNEDTRTYWISKHATADDISSFRLVGAVMGLAMLNGVNVDARLPAAMYQRLMGRPVGLEDLVSVDPDLYRGLNDLLEYEGEDVEDVFCLTFSVTEQWLGRTEQRELCPGGCEKAVTNLNREQYVALRVKYELEEAVETGFRPFRQGFEEVAHCRSLKLLEPRELELILCGEPELDFGALRANARYEKPYTPQHHLVRWFWEVVHEELDKDQQKELLKFVIGSDRAPVGGLSRQRFIIVPNGADDARLPTSHVCFSTLMLPLYSSKEVLRRQLTTAIANSEGFGLR